MEVHVADYRMCIEYQQPQMHINYQGQKKGILAEALKNLVFQAGTYNFFIDIFGGSAGATLAVPRRKNAVYVFNDKDFGMYCLYDTLVDDVGHQNLIKCIKWLQDDLRGKKEFPLIKDLRIDFSKEVSKYYKDKSNHTKAEENVISLPDNDLLNWKRRFYGWYCYFINLLSDDKKCQLIRQGKTEVNGNDIEDKSVIALAEIYLWSFQLYGTKSLSPILNMVLSTDSIYV